MAVKHHDEPSGLISFDYPESWEVQRGDSFQVINQRPPHGAFTITFFSLKVGAEGAGLIRLSFKDRKAGRSTMPGHAMDSWTFAGGGLAGMVTYSHADSGTVAAAEATEAAAIIDSMIIRPSFVPSRPRTWWQRLLGR